ncbi:DUF7576 family protein [Halorussus halophilus]|uniref:DUF7576 family protein n=1 Tax=Halorussus halophilus TaxID=2650975 RepID=UPI00130177F1|nr:hypothetical protein [Halorussus halophilus]
MPELFGIYEGTAATQYVGCLSCDDSIDLNEPHPMYQRKEADGVGDSATQTYHFCSDGCLDEWAEKEGYRS